MTNDNQNIPAPDAAQAVAEKNSLQAAARRSRRSFLITGVLSLAGIGGWAWLVNRPEEDGMPAPLRRVQEGNAKLTEAYYKNTRLAPEFARSRARALRLNGDAGLSDDFDPAAWQLRVKGPGPAVRTQSFSLDEIKALPRIEITTELKCIEGWSVIVTWAGTRLADFLARYPLATRSGRPIADANHPDADVARYVSLLTPNEEYYVGLDIESALHPQTLLCYELNGQPLTPEHGAPLRLVAPLKYGVKHIKRIGSIAFTDERPADYWADRGYDWYGGH